MDKTLPTGSGSFKLVNLGAYATGVFIHPPNVGATLWCQSLIIFRFLDVYVRWVEVNPRLLAGAD